MRDWRGGCGPFTIARRPWHPPPPAQLLELPSRRAPPPGASPSSGRTTGHPLQACPRGELPSWCTGHVAWRLRARACCLATMGIGPRGHARLERFKPGLEPTSARNHMRAGGLLGRLVGKHAESHGIRAIKQHARVIALGCDGSGVQRVPGPSPPSQRASASWGIVGARHCTPLPSPC